MITFLFTGLIAFAISIVLTRLLISILGRVKAGQIIREQGPEAHKAKSGTLTMGGIGFFLAVPLALAATGALAHKRVLVVLGVSAACFLIGLADDMAKFLWKKTEGVKARWRFLIQIALGAAIAFYMLRNGNSTIHLPLGLPGLDLKWMFVPFIIVVFSGTLNSVNFTDGLDGLLGGCTVIVAGAFAVCLAMYGGGNATEFIPLLIALAGAVAGFLWFNAHPATLFMGDTGSLFIGGVFATVAILAGLEIFLLVAGFLFVAEALSVIIQVISFRLTGKRIFRMSPIHHHFELAGWKETQVVLRFWLVCGLFCGAGLFLFSWY